MASRRDQYQAYRFLRRRHTGALLSADTDSAEGPLRRLGASVTASLTVAGLAVAVVAVIGFIRPGGSTSWKSGTSLIVERTTGTRYVYVGGVLHPVANYSSARLILRGNAILVSVDASSFGDTPRGAPVGIPGAPDSLPIPSTLVTSGWTACADPATDATGAPHPRTDLGAVAPVNSRPVTPGTGVLVRDLSGGTYLVWNGSRLRLAAPYVAAALGYAATVPLPVGAAFLNVLPAGADLAAPDIPGRGARGPDVDGRRTRVGQVLRAGGTDGYAVYPDGLAPVTPLQVALLLADPATAAAYPGGAVSPVDVSAAAVAAAPRSATVPAVAGAAPAQAPALADTASTPVALCATVTGPAAPPTLTLAPTTAQALAGDPPTPVDALGVPEADSVTVPPGRGAVLQAVPAQGVGSGTVYLVTDFGVKYPVGAGNTLSDLGLSGVTPTPVPPGLLALFPTGPTLSEPAAAAVLPVTPGSPTPLSSPSS